MNLKALIETVYNTVKQNRTDIFAEYDKAPVNSHEGIYAVTGIEKIRLDNQFMKNNLKRYETEIDLNVKVLGLPGEDPLNLYSFLDSNILSCLVSSGYYLVSAQIGAPVQDHGLQRLILEGKITLKAGSEA